MQKINFKAQQIDGSIFKIFQILMVSFLLQNQIKKFHFLKNLFYKLILVLSLF